MDRLPLLIVYCVLILLASLAGGWLPMLIRLTHRRVELAISFVSGAMAGIALLSLLPHALMERAAALEAAGQPTNLGHGLIEPVLWWVVGGFLVMFVLERFFCFHHHDPPAPDGAAPAGDAHGAHPPGSCAAGRGGHRLTWTGAAVGLTIHSLIAGAALAAAVFADPVSALPGLAAFLVIFLHKPFDSMTLGALMAIGDRPMRQRHIVNGLFALAIPVGVVLLAAGLTGSPAHRHAVLAAALGASTGMFLCIALSDLLPELQFHRHDRVKLTAALLLGLAAAWGVSRLEASGHEHVHAPGAAADHDHDDHDHDDH